MVIDHKKKDFTAFSELVGGDVFEYDDCVYMKLEYEIGGDNAVRLGNGTTDSFFGAANVIRLNARLVID